MAAERRSAEAFPRSWARRAILAAACAGLLARLTFGLGYWVGKPLTNDEQEYLTLARNLADGRGFTYGSLGTVREFGRAPGYPAFVALIALVDPLPPAPAAVPASVKTAQAFVGAVGVFLIGLLAQRTAGPRAGAVAAAVAAIYPPLVWICAYALSEALYSTLALLTAFVLDRSLDWMRGRPFTPGFALAGLVGAAAAMTRPVMLIFLALAALWLLRRRLGREALAFAAAAALVIAPWTARNIRETGRFVLIAPQGGVNFWIGNNALARGEGDLAANPELKAADEALRGLHPGLDAAALEPIYYRAAIDDIAAHPVGWLGLLARKTVYQWIPIGPSYRLHSDRYFIASVVSYVVLLPCAVAGLLGLARRERLPGSLLLLAGSEVLAGLIFFPQERYRIPVIDPTLIVCAAAWAAHAFRASDERVPPSR